MERLRLVENPVDRLARTVEALLVIAAKPLSVRGLAAVDRFEMANQVQAMAPQSALNVVT